MVLASLTATALSCGIVGAAAAGKMFTAYTFERPRQMVVVAFELAALVGAAAMPTHQLRSIELGALFTVFAVAYTSWLVRRQSCSGFGSSKATTLAGLSWRLALLLSLLASASLDVQNRASLLSLVCGVALGLGLGFWRLYRPTAAPMASYASSSETSGFVGALRTRRSAIRIFSAAAAGLLSGTAFKAASVSAAGIHPSYCLMRYQRCTACCGSSCVSGNGCYNGCSGCYSYCLNFATGQYNFCTTTYCW